MAGRTPIKVHLYEKDGRFVNTFNTSAEFAKFIGEKSNYVSNNVKRKDKGITRSGHVYSLNKMGRDSVKDYVRISESPFVMKNNTKGTPKVVAYNLKGEEVISFVNDYIARAVFPGFAYGRSGKRSAGLRFERVTE